MLFMSMMSLKMDTTTALGTVMSSNKPQVSFVHLILFGYSYLEVHVILYITITALIAMSSNKLQVSFVHLIIRLFIFM